MIAIAKEVIMLNLRDYQVDVKREVYQHIKAGEDKILICAGTGSGKTELATAITLEALSKGRRVAFLVHRDNLVRQTIKRFQRYGLSPAAIKSGFKPDYDNPCQIVSIQTLARREQALGAVSDICFYDEAHLTAWSTLGKNLLTSGHHKIAIGLTATPWRLSKKQEMGDLFNVLVCAPVPSELMERKFLVQAKYFGLPGLDTRGVKTVGGDFAQDELGVLVNDDRVITKAVDEWMRLGDRRRTICFAVNVSHSKALVAEFNKRGILAAHVDGDMNPEKEREPIYQALIDGDILVVSSCEALAEGFDVPDVGTVMLCRPTKSKAKFVQQLGRGLRIVPGKINCLVLDQAGNTARHGFIEDLKPSDFLLRRAEEKPPGEAPVKECPDCGLLMRISLMECPECGFVFTAKDKIIADTKLVEMHKQDVHGEVQYSPDMKEYRAWRREAFNKGISPGYASVKYKEKYDTWPKGGYNRGAVFGGDKSDFSRIKYHDYLTRISDRSEKKANWIEGEMEKEFGTEWRRRPEGSLADLLLAV